MSSSKNLVRPTTVAQRLLILVLLCICSLALNARVCEATPALLADAPTVVRSIDNTDSISTHAFRRSEDFNPSTTHEIHLRGTAASSSVAATSSSPTASSIPPPAPFDTSLGNNFTQTSCPAFFNNFLSNSTFKSCVPFSLLLQNSNAFFAASASNSTLDAVLDEACAAPYQTCAPLMTSLAGQLISSSNCASDYSLGNPLVVQAYRGLLSYTPMYKASCLKADPTGRSSVQDFPYCYASSLNSSSGADSMLYFLPLGLGLPGGTSISCSSCTQQTMAIYAAAASDNKSPLNSEYLPAATMINTACGSSFVNASTSIVKTMSTAAPNSAYQKSTSYGSLLATILFTVCALDL